MYFFIVFINMDMKEVYRILSYHRLEQDDEQEIAIKIWQSQDSYNEDYALSTWIGAIVKNFLISKKRSKKEEISNLQIPLSYFEQENEQGHITSSIEPFLASNELSPIDEMIAQENKEELLNRINKLDKIYSEALLKYLRGDYDSTYVTERVKLSRAKDALVQDKKKERYKLIDLQNKQEFYVESLTEAAKIADITTEGIRLALNKSGLFKKKNMAYFNYLKKIFIKT